MSKIAALIMSLASVVGHTSPNASINCRTLPVVVTQGICTRHFGVGHHVVTVAVPCVQVAPQTRLRITDQRSSVQSICPSTPPSQPQTHADGNWGHVWW